MRLKNTKHSNALQKNRSQFEKISFEEFSKELELYRKYEMKTQIIENLIISLEHIPATSIEPERIFSMVGLFLQKGRSSLKVDTLENIILLRLYSIKQKINFLETYYFFLGSRKSIPLVLTEKFDTYANKKPMNTSLAKS